MCNGAAIGMNIAGRMLRIGCRAARQRGKAVRQGGRQRVQAAGPGRQAGRQAGRRPMLKGIIILWSKSALHLLLLWPATKAT